MAKCAEFLNGKPLTAARIFCADEIGFDLNLQGGYNLTKRGIKTCYSLTTSDRRHVSIMSAISAIGISLPGFFVLLGVRKRNKFNERSMKDSEISMTGSGWMTASSFLDWARFFVKQIEDLRGSDDLWALLIVDSHN